MTKTALLQLLYYHDFAKIVLNQEFFIPYEPVCLNFSVRGMQFILDIIVNAKIPEELVNKKSFECFRIWPLALWPYPEHCKDLAFFRIFL